MENKTGHAVYKRGKLHFDEAGWAMIKAAAKRTKKSPTQVVNAALMRYVRLRDKNEKTQDA